MPQIQLVENPRRKKRRRYSAKQLAAGFGGKRYRTRGRKRHRNPALATLAANPRRRFRAYRKSHRRRYSNPSGGFFSGITNMVDLKGAAFIGGGILAAKVGPGLVAKVWPGVPTEGFGKTLVQAGSVLLIATGVKAFLKSSQGAHQIAIGGLGYILYDLANQYVLPNIGMAGLADDGNYVTTTEMEELSGYQPSGTPLSAYIPSQSRMPEMAL